MDITQLRYFLETAEQMNYTRAAQNLFISRQALRQALISMEKELDMPLFVNEHNRLSLTAQGELLRLEAEPVVAAFDSMMEKVKQMDERRWVLRVAFSVSLFPFMLPETDGIVKRFREKYPEIELEIEKLSNDEVVQALKEGRIDCGGVIRMPKPQDEFEMKQLTCYEAALCFGKPYWHWTGKNITIERLAEEQCLCVGVGELKEALYPVWKLCQEKGITIHYEAVPSTIDAFYRVAHGPVIGFDIVKDDVPELDGVSGSILKGYSWEVGLLYRPDSPRSREIEIFSSFMMDEYMKSKTEQVEV